MRILEKKLFQQNNNSNKQYYYGLDKIISMRYNNFNLIQNVYKVDQNWQNFQFVAQYIFFGISCTIYFNDVWVFSYFIFIMI